MMTWPDNKRIAVMMAFDLDAETMWTTRGDGNHDHITNLSRGAYGPKQGVPRILDMLDVYGVKATFFIPGVIAEHYPLVVKEISRIACSRSSCSLLLCREMSASLPTTLATVPASEVMAL